jgi:hypothetical protein
MRILRLLGLISVFCFASIAGLAQQTTPAAASPTTSDPQAVALVQHSLSALAGAATLSDVTLTGTARRIAGSDDETGTATLTALAAGGSKLSLSFPSGNRSETRNPAATPLADSLPSGIAASANLGTQPAGAWSGPDGVLHGIARHNLMTDDAWFLPAVTVGRLSASNYTLSYVGPETRNGQSVAHLSAVRPSSDDRPGIAALEQHLSQMELYLDPATSLPVALTFNTHPDNNALLDIPVEIAFSDYRAVNGVRIPFHVQKYLNGGLVLDIQFSNATLNSGLTAASFQLQ